ncbi:hypothetical protein AN395_03105 [Pseudoalteromonas sp. P1-30]|uniref:hypothetical protein n=1 Tax=Pseudoalteromonas TaxID=53246 RepID=UPI0006D64F2B|nr:MULTISPECIES: hypothetical protein [Pseudoalteromonas]KPV90511.1 hypothetical protein AN395_03105 [Pseudoalteromonas sp. P1-30]MCQ8820901.1 hypothetical protein [Pseudoalteromonas agarivorans]MCQ8887761.1 hypothetical protein [Pseudoalteromonas agarivorans]MDC9522278.1 hypothetical protein [Pseudoalteromonas sp. Angola-31]
MCSSPKSSRAVKKSAINFNDELTQEQRLRFAAKANLAQLRREQRQAANKRFEQKHRPVKKPATGLFSWLQQLVS